MVPGVYMRPSLIWGNMVLVIPIVLEIFQHNVHFPNSFCFENENHFYGAYHCQSLDIFWASEFDHVN